MKKSIIKSFLKEERGSAYILAALSVVPMFGFAALAIDYTAADRSKTELETSTRTVALHVAKRVALDPNASTQSLVNQGKNLMNSITDFPVTYEKFYVDPSSGAVQIVAKTDVETHFMHMFGHDTVTTRVETQAQFGRRNVEVAIAIDNSGSMGDPGGTDADGNALTKLQAAQAAAKALINSASGAVEDLENASLKFSVVPWHTHVRLDTTDLAADPNGPTPSVTNDNWVDWIDWDGYSTEHFRYLAPFLKNGQGDEGDLYYNNPNGDNEWKDYDPNRLTDMIPLEQDGDGVDLRTMKAQPNIGIVTRKDAFKYLGQEWAGCFDHRAGDYRFSFEAPQVPVNWSDTKYDVGFDGDSLFVPTFAPDERDGWRNSYLWDDRGLQDSDDDVINYHDARVYNSAKYVETNPNNHYWWDGRSPNGKCNTALVQGLSDDIKGLTTATSGQTGELKTAIDNMSANGQTDLSIGLEWAMHTLTPWAPLEGAGSFESTQKIMVFMTDGDNYIDSPGSIYWNYHSFGFWYDDPLRKGWSGPPTSTQAHDALNQATKDYCTAIKSKGVKVYFIYFGNASTAATSIVNHCASTPETAIIATNTEEVIAAFEKIGDDIGKLRLTAYDGDDEG